MPARVPHQCSPFADRYPTDALEEPSPKRCPAQPAVSCHGDDPTEQCRGRTWRIVVPVGVAACDQVASAPDASLSDQAMREQAIAVHQQDDVARLD